MESIISRNLPDFAGILQDIGWVVTDSFYYLEGRAVSTYTYGTLLHRSAAQVNAVLASGLPSFLCYNTLKSMLAWFAFRYDAAATLYNAAATIREGMNTCCLKCRSLTCKLANALATTIGFASESMSCTSSPVKESGFNIKLHIHIKNLDDDKDTC